MSFFAIGVMTGTSCDGADLAVLKLSESGGTWKELLFGTLSKNYPAPLRTALRLAQKDKLPMSQVAEVQVQYSEWIADLCKDAIRRFKIPASSVVFGVHGQTIWHKPPSGRKRGYSIQLVDPAIIAHETNATTVSQFRQPDLSRFGQGAPLVPYYHWLRASSVLSSSLPLVLINIGGISNLTFVPRSKDKILAFDCGPGNALIDLAVERFTKGRKLFDSGGVIGSLAAETIQWEKIRKITSERYYKANPPKSTGRELFNEKYLGKIPGKDAALISNATALTAAAVAQSIKDFLPHKNIRFAYVCGGGAKNPFLLKLLQKELQRQLGHFVSVAPLPEKVAPPQYVEAMAFARLGFESLLSNTSSLKVVTGAKTDNFGAAIFPGANFRKLMHAIYK